MNEVTIQQGIQAEINANILNCFSLDEKLSASMVLVNDGLSLYNVGTVTVNYKRINRNRPPNIICVRNSTGAILPFVSFTLDGATGVFLIDEYIVMTASRTHADILMYSLYSNAEDFTLYLLKDKSGRG